MLLSRSTIPPTYCTYGEDTHYDIKQFYKQLHKRATEMFGNLGRSKRETSYNWSISVKVEYFVCGECELFNWLFLNLILVYFIDVITSFAWQKCHALKHAPKK